MRKLPQFLIFLSLCVAPSRAQSISGGTAAVMVRTPSRVSVSIDSKEIYRYSKDGGVQTSSLCASKLRRVGNYVAVVAGFAKGSNGYDALELIAAHAKPTDSLSEVIEVARREIGTQFQSLLRELSKANIDIETFHKRGDAAIQIGVIGVEGRVPKMAVLEFFADDPSGNMPPRTTLRRCPEDCGSNIYAYLLGTHSEIREKLVSSPDMLKHISTDGMKQLVALEAVAHPETVGGPTATATIASDGKSVVDPGNCGSTPEAPQVVAMVGAASATGSVEEISEAPLPSVVDDQLSRMSDLQCHQTVHRYIGTQKRTRHLDDLEFDVELHSGEEKYSQIKRKKKLYSSLQDLPGSWSSGELATVLRVTRDALQHSTVAAHGSSTEQRITFSVPAQKHEWYFLIDGSPHWMDIQGSVSFEDGKIKGIEWVGINLPVNAGIRQIKLSITFSGTDVAEKTFRVPDRSVFEVQYADALIGSTLDVSAYSNFRRLGATSSLSF